MRKSFIYLYNIGGRDIEKHLMTLDLHTIEKRVYNDGKLPKKPRKETHQRKGFNYDGL